MRRALVMGGGGVIGVAWEMGLLAGLAEAGVDVREADLVVGTSAGSMVGSRVAAGFDFLEAPQETSQPSKIPLPEAGPDMVSLRDVFQTWSAAEIVTRELLCEIGALASSARTVSEQEWVASMGASANVEAWPDTPLRICAIDVETGELCVHSRESGAPLPAAIASSCAIPGMFPPVSIDGSRYMDGGVRSGTSADIVLDIEPDSVLIVAPICEKTAVIGALAERCLEREVEQLERTGINVSVVLPEGAEIEAFGGNLMDPAGAAESRAAGRARGLRLAGSGEIAW